MLSIKYILKYFTEWLNYQAYELRIKNVNNKQPHTEHKAISLKSDYFGLCSPLLATKIEDICCTSRVVTDYTGVLLYSNTGSL